MGGNDTIFALSSGSGRAGVAVIRISGVQAKHILNVMGGDHIEPRRASLRSIVDPQTEEILDRALVLWFPGPGSFTGEDVVELHIHGGPAVISAVVNGLATFESVRMAEPGEFTRRAFYHQKLDLTGIEALADLIDAQTEGQRKQALRQMRGGLSRVLDRWRQQLIHILAYVEAGIDFSDEEDVGDEVNLDMVENIKALKNEICKCLDDGRSGERLRSGLHVVIAGPTNAGKSSLLNALANRDVAIVSDQAGTTRDVIEVHLDINGYPVLVSDTAGLRESLNTIEEEGVRRANDRIKNADVILWTTDSCLEEETHGFEIDSDQHLIRLRNKSDIDSEFIEQDLRENAAAGTPVLLISATTGAGLDKLIEMIATIADSMQSSQEHAVITRARHRQALVAVVENLSSVLVNPGEADEITAEKLRIAVRELGRVTGRVDVEDLLDVIFNDFCVGK